MSDKAYTYEGGELELFSAAVNWKSYFRSQLAPHLGQRVLEVGAGLGGTTGVLCAEAKTERWVCLEPDQRLLERLQAAIDRGELPACCQPLQGSLAAVPVGETFDSVLYIDVLEHIEDDAAELARAATFLAPGGRLIVLGPAHPWLFTPFDRAIGHYRRYTRKSLAALTPPGLKLIRSAYLDAVGLSASLGNRMLLKSAMPTARQIALWDKAMVPASRMIDPLLAFRVGKSVLTVWRREGADADQPSAA